MITSTTVDAIGSTAHTVTYDRALCPPSEPMALIALRLAPDQMFGTFDAFVDVAVDYRDLGHDDNEIRPAVLNILPKWLRDLADRIEADGMHEEHLA